MISRSADFFSREASRVSTPEHLALSLPGQLIFGRPRKTDAEIRAWRTVVPRSRRSASAPQDRGRRRTVRECCASDEDDLRSRLAVDEVVHDHQVAPSHLVWT
jgi:hypothetical protein